MTKRIVFLGAGGFGALARDLCETVGWEPYGFIDNFKPAGTRVNGCPILGKDDLIEDGQLVKSCEFVLAVQDAILRRDWAARIEKAGGTLTRITHPWVEISPSASIGKGVMINAFSFIYANAVVGNYVLIESHCNIGISVKVDRLAMVATGVHMNNGTTVGEGTFLGSCSVSRPGVKIGRGCLVGAGSVVVKDIPDFKVVAGSPARVLRDNAIAL
jgi:sugar O-acyltransferase (sialic acid O-acetyltransferase NeuD family)